MSPWYPETKNLKENLTSQAVKWSCRVDWSVPFTTNEVMDRLLTESNRLTEPAAFLEKPVPVLLHFFCNKNFIGAYNKKSFRNKRWVSWMRFYFWNKVSSCLEWCNCGFDSAFTVKQHRWAKPLLSVCRNVRFSAHQSSGCCCVSKSKGLSDNTYFLPEQSKKVASSKTFLRRCLKSLISVVAIVCFYSVPSTPS